MILYLDSSAFVKRYVAERGSPEVAHEIASASDIAAASITRAEVAGALGKLVRRGAITQAELGAAVQLLATDWPAVWEVPVDAGVIQLAHDLAITHSLRGYDAAQLAGAVTLSQAVTDPIVVATFDDELWPAVQAEGLTAWPSDLTLFR